MHSIFVLHACHHNMHVAIESIASNSTTTRHSAYYLIDCTRLLPRPGYDFDADGVGVDCIHKIQDVQPSLPLLTCPSCPMQPPW